MPGGRTALVGLLVATALAGCGGGETRTVTVTQGREPQTLPETVTTTQPPQPRALAEGGGSRSGRPFSFRILELRRSGATVALNATLTADPQGERDVRVSDLFGDGLTQRLKGRRGIEDDDVFDGVALIDTQNRRTYLVARDATGRCVCSRRLARVVSTPGVPVSLTATLAAPPDGVTRVDVVVPNVRTFTGVPLAG
ncbi:MAG: hypothetical protein QOC64_2439 [Solirubrobacteraceae bacterium]|jgi:hypothetical protein|nr:hypothetical protein [Solirubrobacteraceae bacterium]